MTSVLKNQSAAGETYEALFDGARSLVTGLGSMLRVSSYRARMYGSTLSEDSAHSLVLTRQRRDYKEGNPLFASHVGGRSEREMGNQQSESQREVSSSSLSSLSSSSSFKHGITIIYIYKKTNGLPVSRGN